MLPPSRFDTTFTQRVIDSIGPSTPPRARQIMTSLIRHLHDFSREVELTPDEWMTGVSFLNAVGQVSDEKRNEGQRVSDVLGLESLVDEIAHKHISESGSEDLPTPSSILGPFYSPHAPLRPLGSSIIQSPPPPPSDGREDERAQVTLMHGVVSDLVSGNGIANALVEIWQASSNGKYDFQDPEGQSENNLRGKFRTDAEGKYALECLKPTAYSLPTDGPAGQLLQLLDRHPMRPAHIHLMVTAPGYKPLTTQIFPRTDPYLKTDTVFAVKPDLVVDFKPRAAKRSEDKKAGNVAGKEWKQAPEDGKGAVNVADDESQGKKPPSEVHGEVKKQGLEEPSSLPTTEPATATNAARNWKEQEALTVGSDDRSGEDGKTGGIGYDEDDEEAELDLEYNIRLAPVDVKGAGAAPAGTGAGQADGGS